MDVSEEPVDPGFRVRPTPPRRAPDLLFEAEQHVRVAEIAPLIEHPERLGAQTVLHRLTVFLTYRCNLACPYCKTIARNPAELERFPQKLFSHDLASFEQLLDTHCDTPLRHLHFTGGEGAMVPGLVQMVRLAKERGVEALSMTSNGTLAPGLYLELVGAGLDELRISLDANEAALGEQLTSRVGAFGATVRTLTALAEARRDGTRFALIINTVVGVGNRRRVPQLLRFLLSFAPDDVKLITEVDLRDELGDFPELARVRAEVQALLAQLPAATLPLLRRKLETVFARDAIGLASETAAFDNTRARRPELGADEPSRANWRCYIPLTERTVDRAFYYPCSVYLREGGEPLGSLTDSPEVQRERSAAFARDAECLKDPICKRYCLHCTRSFNALANRARR